MRPLQCHRVLRSRTGTGACPYKPSTCRLPIRKTSSTTPYAYFFFGGAWIASLWTSSAASITASESVGWE